MSRRKLTPRGGRTRWPLRSNHVVYAHSLDFGKKAYGNLVELARVQGRVGAALGAPVGLLVVHAKSAHVYTADDERVRGILESARNHQFVKTSPQ